MSSGWSWYVIILTAINIVACFWLIRWTSKRRPGEAAQGDTMGHVWDENLEEYNNPLPRWWLWLFYITIIFSVVYLVLYPGMGNFSGVKGWTQVSQYEQEVQAADAQYGPIFARYAEKDLAALANDAEAVAVGRRLYLNYCSTCHGSDARGASGFPNLTDNEWLYGGDGEAVKTSILEGRSGMMPPMGDALGEQGVEEVGAYVLQLAGREADAALAQAGQAKYDTFCAACHMPDGSGNAMLGAPDLTNDVWLYGGSTGAIKASIKNGRNGQMPPHREFLGEEKSHVIAAYVLSLSAAQ